MKKEQENLYKSDKNCVTDQRYPEIEEPPMSSTRSFYSLHARVRSHSRSLRAMANPSAVWAYFDLCSNDPLRAQCRLCRAVVVRGGANPRQCGTTNLHRHLRVHHGGRLVGKRYHVINEIIRREQEPHAAKMLKLTNQGIVREMRKISSVTSLDAYQVSLQQNRKQQHIQNFKPSKAVMVKTTPLKFKQVTATTIKKIPFKPNISQASSELNVPQLPTEVCLRWNSYHSNMQHSFPTFLDSEEFVDVTLACEGRSLKCHKMILSSCSDYLAKLLRENPCQHPIILMKDLKFWEVDSLVKFMYCGEVNVTHDKLPHLLNAAETLQIKGLAGPSNLQSSKPPSLFPRIKTSPPQLLKNCSQSKKVEESFKINTEKKNIFQKRRFTGSLPEAQPVSKTCVRRSLIPKNKPTETTVKSEPDDDLFESNKLSQQNLEENEHLVETVLHKSPSRMIEKNLFHDNNTGISEKDLVKNSYPGSEHSDDRVRELTSSDFLEQSMNEKTNNHGNSTCCNSFESNSENKEEEDFNQLKQTAEDKTMKKTNFEEVKHFHCKKPMIKLRSDRTKKEKNNR